MLIGPTAVGKTALSLELAKYMPIEIISGDSMQVYRGMDIGTGKATLEERSIVPHHMIDIRDPDEPFSVTEFKQQAQELITAINERGNIPLIVGGTGLYIESVCYDYGFSRAAIDEPFREKLRQEATTKGTQALHRKLEQLDAEAASRIHPNDLRRIIRALEVIHQTGESFSSYQKKAKKESPYQLCIICLTMDRQLLYKRIEERIDNMLEQGWLEEVEVLRKNGYTKETVSMQALGYKELDQHLDGQLEYEEAVQLIKRNTRRFAKRQLSWFRHMKDVHWVDVTDAVFNPEHKDKILREIVAIAAGKLMIDEEYTKQRFL